MVSGLQGIHKTRSVCQVDHEAYYHKHRASKGMFYIGGRGCVLCQFIEAVIFARCAFIFALQNITLGGY